MAKLIEVKICAVSHEFINHDKLEFTASLGKVTKESVKSLIVEKNPNFKVKLFYVDYELTYGRPNRKTLFVNHVRKYSFDCLTELTNYRKSRVL